jgi:hypothetical protein
VNIKRKHTPNSSCFVCDSFLVFAFVVVLSTASLISHAFFAQGDENVSGLESMCRQI